MKNIEINLYSHHFQIKIHHAGKLKIKPPDASLRVIAKLRRTLIEMQRKNQSSSPWINYFPRAPYLQFFPNTSYLSLRRKKIQPIRAPPRHPRATTSLISKEKLVSHSSGVESVSLASRTLEWLGVREREKRIELKAPRVKLFSPPSLAEISG